ncbi:MULTISPECIES: OmpH family outer membrane protein [Polyangium]|uniref:OmpH family outer membrane protein n=2 Tax=Polyangium TaxID=55 RepID=A0A4U1IVP5_9BACT|nr:MULTISPECIES: OmpH family outer membrane protein [Polyangium]MDI1436781.1 OmpH family outer membrane protein [Polyangium sorediatum]TKC98075.1 OmpH family outer membrane protein [Polyangium fumosum]
MLLRRLPRLHAALAATVLSALVSLAPGSASAENKIAVVDVQQAVMQTEDGIRAQGTLKKLFDKRQKELDAKQEELQRAREDIERQARVLSREALARRMEDWQRRMVELQTSFVDYNKELQKKQGDLTGPILRKMMGIITRLAKKNGYELILDRSATPYARPDLDLTEQVVQMYNSGGDGGGDAPPEGGGDKPSGGGDEKK